MRKIRWSNLANKRYFIMSLCTVYIALPVVADVLSVGAAEFLPGTSVAWAAPDPGEIIRELQLNDPGMQLNQAREYMERQRIAQQIEEDRKKNRDLVQTDVKMPEETEAKLTFTLTKVETDPSEVLTEAELQNITAPYVGKTVSLADLYAITGAINNLYNDKGYMICKAYLPPQRIHGGVVQIKLLEGKTGMVTLQGLKHTREKYVTARVPLKPGTVANTAALNKELQRFNGTNDVQLRVLVHAGKEPATTDYEIVAYEPKQNQFVTAYLDYNGYETSGRFRQGLYYNIHSLTGMRDSLRLNYLRSQGTNLYGLGYSVPVSKMGTRLDIDYSTNTTKKVNQRAFKNRDAEHRKHQWRNQVNQVLEWREPVKHRVQVAHLLRHIQFAVAQELELLCSGNHAASPAGALLHMFLERRRRNARRKRFGKPKAHIPSGFNQHARRKVFRNRLCIESTNIFERLARYNRIRAAVNYAVRRSFCSLNHIIEIILFIRHNALGIKIVLKHVRRIKALRRLDKT